MQKIILIIGLFSIIVMNQQIAEAQEQTVLMKVSGMTCGTCPIAVRRHVLKMQGVHTASVDLDSSIANITYEDSEQSPQAIAEGISRLGYPTAIIDNEESAD